MPSKKIFLTVLRWPHLRDKRWDQLAAYLNASKTRTDNTRSSDTEGGVRLLCLSVSMRGGGLTWASGYFGIPLTLVLSQRRWLHWLKVSHTGCLLWTSTSAPLKPLVVTITPLPLQDTFVHPTWHATPPPQHIHLNPITHLLTVLQKKEKEKEKEKKTKSENFQFLSLLLTYTHNFKRIFACPGSIVGALLRRAPAGYPITVHHSYAFSTAWRGKWCGGSSKQNKTKLLTSWDGPGQFLGSCKANWVHPTHLFQWLSLVPTVRHPRKKERKRVDLIVLAFITGNSSLEPLLEGLFAQNHIDLSWWGFGWNQTWDLRMTQLCLVQLVWLFCKQTNDQSNLTRKCPP